MRTWLRGLAAVVGVVLASGCGGSADHSGSATPQGGGTSAKGGSGSPKVLFVTNGNSDWWNAVEKGMTDAAAAIGCQVELKRNNGQLQGQVEKLREALARSDVSGVAVSVYEADAPGVIDAMRELQKSGKVVIAIDSDVAADAADARSGYIGTNNVKAGEVAGRAARTLRPGGGKVQAFVGVSSAANARERIAGFIKGAGEKFVLGPGDTWEDGNDPGRASSNVKSAITKTPDLGLLLGIWSYNAAPIAEEVRGHADLRKRASVVTFDLDEAAVDHLAHGDIDASVCQNPYEMGYQGVKLLKALIQKDDKAAREVLPDGKARDTGVRVIVPRADSPVMKEKQAQGDDVITIDEMKTWLESKGLKSS
jgi:ribose transport system substrate-binding protein